MEVNQTDAHHIKKSTGIMEYRKATTPLGLLVLVPAPVGVEPDGYILGGENMLHLHASISSAVLAQDQSFGVLYSFLFANVIVFVARKTRSQRFPRAYQWGCDDENNNRSLRYR